MQHCSLSLLSIPVREVYLHHRQTAPVHMTHMQGHPDLRSDTLAVSHLRSGWPVCTYPLTHRTSAIY